MTLIESLDQASYLIGMVLFLFKAGLAIFFSMAVYALSMRYMEYCREDSLSVDNTSDFFVQKLDRSKIRNPYLHIGKYKF